MKGNKKLLALASAALLLGACAQETVLTPDEARELDPKSNEISFGTYMGKSSQTRAGAEGTITTDGAGSTQSLQNLGFGVFAYYTGNTNYEAGQTSTAPNFMYNQKVSYDGSSNSWSYSPVKYWPNDISTAENGNVDTQTSPAQGSAGGGKVSFFAYAPYVGTYTPDGGSENTFNPSTGQWTTPEATGITGFSNNENKGDPTLTFVVNGVDLLWGTADGTDENVLGAAQTVTTLTGGKGAVNANLTKQKTDGKVKFLFKHALASLAGGKVGSGNNFGFMVQLDIDGESGISDGEREQFATSGTTYDAWRTIVTIRDITITNDLNGNQSIDGEERGLPTSGTLNLATGQWTPTGAATGIVSQKIGTNIGSETTYDAVLNKKLAEVYDNSGSSTTWFAKETETPKKVADYFKFILTNAEHPGVTETPMNVYNSETQSPLLIIPGTEPKFKITVDYIVRTYDAALSNKCTKVEQKISKTITFPAFELNKHYSLIMHLGLTGIKFTATVADWADGHIGTAGGGTGSESDDTYLPINVQ